jgi:hypothetical protein
MQKLLLTVEQVFAVTDRRIIVAPKIRVDREHPTLAMRINTQSSYIGQ